MRSNSNRHDAVTWIVALILASSLVAGAGIASTDRSDTGTSESTPVAGESTGIWTTTANDTESTVSIANLSAPDRVRLGENYTVTATVRNAGDTFTVRRVAYHIAGNVLAVEWVPLPNGTAQTVTLDVGADRTHDFPNGTFTHGVFAADARATGEVAVGSAAEQPPEERTTVQSDEQPSADTESADVLRIHVTVDDSEDGIGVSVSASSEQRSDYVVVVDQRLRDDVVQLLEKVLDVNEQTASKSGM